MKDKEVAKKYLVAVLALYGGGVLVLTLLTAALARSDTALWHGVAVTPLHALACGAALSLLPAGSFTGFVWWGVRLKETELKRGVLFIVLFPLVLIFVTVFGIVMFLPCVFRAVVTIIRG